MNPVKTKIGISIDASCGIDSEKIGRFDFAELMIRRGEELRLSNRKLNGGNLRLGNFLPQDIFDAIVSDGRATLRGDFEKLLMRQTAAATRCGVEVVTFRIDYERLNDSAYAASAVTLLRSVWDIMKPFKLKLATLRLPGDFVTMEQYRELNNFRRNLMLPGLEWMFDLHPHEPRAWEMAQLAAANPWQCRNWRFSYDPAVGNRFPTEKIRELCNRISEANRLPAYASIAPAGLQKPDDAALDYLLAIKEELQ